MKTIVFDKTGTLTHGKPIVTKVLLFVSETVCPNHLFAAIVGVAESSSEHPLGMAVVNFAKQVTFHISLCIEPSVQSGHVPMIFSGSEW